MFQVGDLITGIPENRYGITGPESVCRVIGVNYGEERDKIFVQYLGKRGSELNFNSRREFLVHPKWFKRFTVKMMQISLDKTYII